MDPIIQTQYPLTTYQKLSQLKQDLADQEIMMKNVANKSLAQVKGFLLLSVYEQAHQKYNANKEASHIKSKKYKSKCTACGSPDHLYKKKLNGDIICPITKNNQEAWEKGKKGYIKILERAKLSRKAKFLKKKKAQEELRL